MKIKEQTRQLAVGSTGVRQGDANVVWIWFSKRINLAGRIVTMIGWVNRWIIFYQKNTDWVIDGNYSWCFYERRMAEADQIIFLNFSRWNCLYRAFKRYLKYRHKTRESMASGCPEKFDWELISWVLWKGRRQTALARYKRIRQTFPQKFYELRNQKELTSFLQNLKTSEP